MRVKVLSRAEVEAGGAIGAGGVISIRATADAAEPELAAALAQASQGQPERVLQLRFDDIGMAEYGYFVGPTQSHVGEAIDFARRIADLAEMSPGHLPEMPHVVIHCEFGKSRSAALALALIADHLGAGAEEEAVARLLGGDTERRMHPNPRIVDLADAHLGRAGRLEAALVASSPAYVRWRDLWRKIIADPDAYWEKAEYALSRGVEKPASG